MTDPVKVQFVWHLHQPYYGLPTRPSNYLPWVRLHSVKSYYDMARTLERFPQVRATINFSGSLLRQIREYSEEGRRDTWWDLTLKDASSLDEQDRRHLMRHFFSLPPEACIDPYPRYRELLEKRGPDGQTADLDLFGAQEYRDLQVWFNLAWFGFSAREERPIISELIAKDRGFTEGEKEALLEQQIDIMQLLIPLYRDLHRRGQIELSVTPMYHPILPLVIDTNTMLRSTPNREAPTTFSAPQDAADQVWMARSIMREFLGVDVNGMWPAEGAISPEAVALFEANELSWIASDEQVLQASRGSNWSRDEDLYRPWKLGDLQTSIFFRDRDLSDRIGFVYAKMDPHDAARDLLERLEACPGPVVSVILDGENPWVNYPDEGKQFLESLYEKLSVSSRLQTTTPTEFLDEHGCQARLDGLHSGSWIDGNFAVWIGGDEDNKAWDYLGQTRRDLAARLQDVQLDPDVEEAVWEALYVAEGSDWFWWYGDEFHSANDADFDRLFRAQLRFVYTSVGLEAPEFLDQPITSAAAPELHFEPPTRLITPRVDGTTEFFYEWNGAGLYRNTGGRGSVYDSVRLVDRIFLGFDLTSLYVRSDYLPQMRQLGEGLVVRVFVKHTRGTFLAETTPRGGGSGWVEWLEDGSRIALEGVAFGTSIEIAIPFADLELDTNDTFKVWIVLADEGSELERHPPEGGLELQVPDRSFEMRNWIV